VGDILSDLSVDGRVIPGIYSEDVGNDGVGCIRLAKRGSQ
jgi:hypothetical protein